MARIDLGDKLPNYLHNDVLDFFGVKKWPQGYRVTTITKNIHLHHAKNCWSYHSYHNNAQIFFEKRLFLARIEPCLKCSEAVVGILHVDPSDAFSFLLTVSSQSHQSLESRREPSASLGRPLSIFSKSKSILPLADQCVETKVWRKTKKRCQVLDTILGSLTVSAARERIDRTPRSLDSYAHCLTWKWH